MSLESYSRNGKSCDQKEKQGIKSRVMILELLTGNWWGNENFRPEGTQSNMVSVLIGSLWPRPSHTCTSCLLISDACWYYL